MVKIKYNKKKDMIIIDGGNNTKSMYLFSSNIVDYSFDLHKVKDGYCRRTRRF